MVIIVAIIGILAVLAVPNFVRMRINSNENVVRHDLRAFSTANESYRALQVPPVFSPDVQTLINENYLDETWLNPGNRHGYTFIYMRGNQGVTYSHAAAIVTPGVTGVNYYCVDQSGVVFQSPAAGMGTAGGCVGGVPVSK